MFIEKKIASEILEKYGRDSLDLLKDEDNFLIVVSNEYTAIIETLRSQSMIVNPEKLRETIYRCPLTGLSAPDRAWKNAG